MVDAGTIIFTTSSHPQEGTEKCHGYQKDTKRYDLLAKWDAYNENCPTRLVLDRIADKWTVLVIGSLTHGTRRFGELRREIGGISQKMLTQTLRGLERDGLVHRKIYPTIPPKVEYSLTPLGITLIKVLEEIRVWAEKNIEQVLRSQEQYDTLNNNKKSSSQ